MPPRLYHGLFSASSSGELDVVVEGVVDMGLMLSTEY